MDTSRMEKESRNRSTVGQEDSRNSVRVMQDTIRMTVAGSFSDGLSVRRPEDKVVMDEQGARKVAGLAAKRTGSTV